MKFIFKPFVLDTSAYFGPVLHNDACDEGGTHTRYQTSLKRALNCLSAQGCHSNETIFNDLTRDKNAVLEEDSYPRFTFSYKTPEVEQTLFEFLTEDTTK